jgi:hypothetical protein
MLKYKEFKNWLNEAAKKPSKSDVPPIMYEHAKKYNKVDEFASFVDLLPTDAFKGIDLVFNKILSTPNNIKDFFEHLYTYNVIEDIKASDYSHGLSQIIFEAEPKGLGRGELFIAWRIKNAEISGGGKSFDVQIGNKHYEVKEYSNTKDGSIRLGVKGKITRFEFWKEIVDTLRRLDKLTGYSTKLKFDFSKYFDSEFSRISTVLLDSEAKWLSGEMGKEDFANLQLFYDLANKLENKVDKDLITTVILRGPDAKPTELAIEPISIKELDKDHH